MREALESATSDAMALSLVSILADPKRWDGDGPIRPTLQICSLASVAPSAVKSPRPCYGTVQAESGGSVFFASLAPFRG